MLVLISEFDFVSKEREIKMFDSRLCLSRSVNNNWEVKETSTPSHLAQ